VRSALCRASAFPAAPLLRLRPPAPALAWCRPPAPRPTRFGAASAAPLSRAAPRRRGSGRGGSTKRPSSEGGDKARGGGQNSKERTVLPHRTTPLTPTHLNPAETACHDGAHQCIFTGRLPKDRPPHAHGQVQPPSPFPVGEVAGERVPWVDEPECVGCNLCALVCPVEGCIQMVEVPSDKGFESWHDRIAKGTDKVPGGLHDLATLRASFPRAFSLPTGIR
jgi:NAD-dependent dihydropyrimidine dehydrogenase PreA subunit